MIKALLLDVDGVLVDGRPEDGRHWQTSLQADLGVDPAELHAQFFAPYWDAVVLGHAGLLEHLTTALRTVAPTLDPTAFISYWFERDSRVATGLLSELALLRSDGIAVYLATNQEHLRACYLMETLGLAAHVDDIFYSARLGAKKPEMRFFTQVETALGMHGDELLLIDDSGPNIDAARQAGWRAFRWTQGTAPAIVRDLCRTGAC